MKTENRNKREIVRELFFQANLTFHVSVCLETMQCAAAEAFSHYIDLSSSLGQKCLGYIKKGRWFSLIVAKAFRSCSTKNKPQHDTPLCAVVCHFYSFTLQNTQTHPSDKRTLSYVSSLARVKCFRRLQYTET